MRPVLEFLAAFVLVALAFSLSLFTAIYGALAVVEAVPGTAAQP